MCDMKLIIVIYRGVDFFISWVFLSLNYELEMFYFFGGKVNREWEFNLLFMKKIVILCLDWVGLLRYVKIKVVW